METDLYDNRLSREGAGEENQRERDGENRSTSPPNRKRKRLHSGSPERKVSQESSNEVKSAAVDARDLLGQRATTGVSEFERNLAVFAMQHRLAMYEVERGAGSVDEANVLERVARLVDEMQNRSMREPKQSRLYGSN